MKMSVYRQGQPVTELEHLALMRQAVNSDNAEMVMHAWMEGATVLVGLNHGEAIVKPQQDGDEALSFEALYDTCISLAQWKRMRAQKVKTPEALAPFVYRMKLQLLIEEPIELTVELKAHDDIEVRTLITRLAREDKEFGTALIQRFAQALIAADYDGRIGSAGALKWGEATEATPVWRFVDDDPDKD